VSAHRFLRGLFAAFLAVLLVIPAGAGSRLNVKGTRVVAGGGTDLYSPWYPALDLNTLPFQQSTGGWGAAQPVSKPNLPVTTTSTSVTSLAALQTACNLSGRVITITAGFVGGSVSGTCNDTDVIVNSGVVITSGLLFNASTRFRIRGPTPGTFSGGHVHELAFGGGAWTDLSVDGISITGDDSDGQHALIIFNGANRVAITNNRFNCGAACYIGVCTHIVFAGNSMNSGAGPGNGSLEAWGIREGGAGPIVVVNNDIRSARTPGNPAYHRFRTAPPDNNQLSYVAGNTFVDLSESRIWWINTYSGHQPALTSAAGAWFLTNQVYTTGSGLSIQSGAGGNGSSSSSDDNVSASYVRVNGNTIYGTGLSVSDIDIAGTGLVDGDKTSNTFNSTAAAPAWGAAGDPTALDWTP
jgi:hypothetical protein